VPRNIRLSFVIAGAVLLLPFPALSTSSDSQSCRSGATPPAAEAITLRAVGDIVLGNNWPTGGWPAGYEQDTERQLRRVLGDADVIFGNFEGALTTHAVSMKQPRPGAVFAFRMPPHFAKLLRNAGFNVMAIANNHTFDFGPAGYADTKTHLAAAGMLLTGEPHQITLHKVRDVTIAWIGFSHLPHHNYIGNLERLETMLNESRTKADLVIVSMQAGAEGSEALRIRDRNETFLGEERGNTFMFAHQAIDLGADLVIGHGPHVLRGMECYKGKLIAYSLGNFAGYGALSTKRAAAISAVLEIRLAKNRETLGFAVIPVRFDDQRLPEIDEEKLALYLINDLSRRPPLNGTIRFPVTDAGEKNYRRWLDAADLVKILNEP
jgi:hypothetical protein